MHSAIVPKVRGYEQEATAVEEFSVEHSGCNFSNGGFEIFPF